MIRRWIFIILLTLSAGCTNQHKVYLIKQWHLSPYDSTIDINKSRQLPQYENQVDIYKQALKLIQVGVKSVIAEGCEGTIDENFKLNYNGWNLQKLKAHTQQDNFIDILAPVPLKIKAKLGASVKVICGDNLEEIKLNNLAFSDLKAYSGFFQRLYAYHNTDQMKYDKYVEALKNVVDLKSTDDPILVAKEKVLESLAKFEHQIKKRNEFFLKKIKEEIEGDPILVIGGLHVPDLIKRLEREKISYQVLEPSSYPPNELKLYEDIKSLVSNYSNQSKLVFHQVPEGFDPTFLKLKDLIPVQKLATDQEWKEIVKLSERYHFNPDLLRLDFDKDGIRDFTISNSSNQVVIAAEDQDWDNDGILNMLDSSIGKRELYHIPQVKNLKENRYHVLGVEPQALLEFFEKKNIALLETQSAQHDMLILKIFSEVLKLVKFDIEKVKIFKATEPQFTYGKQVFFSYIPSSETIEFYPKRLFKYISTKRESEFRGASDNSLINGFLTPLVIHSLGHELAHAINFDVMKYAKQNGWRWTEDKVHSKYLSSFRQENKKKKVDYQNFSFAGVRYADWLKNHKQYVDTVNHYLKKYPDTKSFNQHIKDLPWSTKIISERKELQLSFLLSKNIPSLYAMSSPQEWFAELVASCFFRKLYPNSSKKEEAVRYELTIGFNPTVANDALCALFI